MLAATFLGFGLLAATACNPGPGAGIRRPSYPALTQSTKTYSWLIVRCQLSDVSKIPAGLDTKIQQFFGISGSGYGNIIDYFHDISYNSASVVGDTSLGWIQAPFSTATLPRWRQQRVAACLNAIPANQLPDLDQYYGVIVVNNVVQDGGACATGQIPIKVNDKTYNLGCVWFDPASLYTGFAAHEIGHGLGLDHSYDDSQDVCAIKALPGEYCDHWDLMSALISYEFVDQNWGSGTSGAGPGLSAPGLLRMGWLQSGNVRQYDGETGGEQSFTLHALSHPRAGEPMAVIIPVASLKGASQFLTVEYRQSDGWDTGFGSTSGFTTQGSVPGAVLVHRMNNNSSAPVLSHLIENPAGGAIQPCRTLVFFGDDGIVFHVKVASFNLAEGSATVSMGFGALGPFFSCPTQEIRSPGGVIFIGH